MLSPVPAPRAQHATLEPSVVDQDTAPPETRLPLSSLSLDSRVAARCQATGPGMSPKQCSWLWMSDAEYQASLPRSPAVLSGRY